MASREQRRNKDAGKADFIRYLKQREGEKCYYQDIATGIGRTARTTSTWGLELARDGKIEQVMQGFYRYKPQNSQGKRQSKTDNNSLGRAAGNFRVAFHVFKELEMEAITIIPVGICPMCGKSLTISDNYHSQWAQAKTHIADGCKSGEEVDLQQLGVCY